MEVSMLCVVISSTEAYRDAADLIVRACAQCSIVADIVDINDINITSCTAMDMIFFLTNDSRVGRMATAMMLKGVDVVNGTYLTGNRAKSFAQKRVRAAGVAVPRIIHGIDFCCLKNENAISDISFPLYVKSENHGQGVFRVERELDLQRIISRLDPNMTWYAEEAVDAYGRILVKLYWVAGVCFSKYSGRETVQDEWCEAMHTIGNTLSLDIFSADFVVGESFYRCIDINPAPGFFGSQAAREALVRLIQMRATRPAISV